MINNKQQTAVEWLQSIELERDLTLADWALAKEIEKEQIVDAYDYGSLRSGCEEGEQYYNETYGENDQ
jgi:hypothetical protein